MAKKRTEKELREELEQEKSIFRLKKRAQQAGVDPALVRESTNAESIIELIIEKELGVEPSGGGKKDKPAKKGKKEEDPPEGDDDDSGGDDSDDDSDDDDDKDGDDSDDGDDPDDDAPENDEEEAPPPKTAVKPPKTAVAGSDPILKLTAEVAALRKVVEAMKADLDAFGKFVVTTFFLTKSGFMKVGKVVGTKGLTKRFDEIIAEHLQGEGEGDGGEPKEED
jgi:hypothetical protein